MHDDLLSIGALARAGGLPVGTLRFYDAAGVLPPAHVDPVTGYRWYSTAQVHTARLVAALRQAGLPVAELTAALRVAPQEAATLLANHRRRLADDLAAACAHLDAATALLDQPAHCTVAAPDVATAVAAVRHAVGSDPAWPGLGGILLHLDGTCLRVVGCDRFRIAVATVAVRHLSGPAVRVVAPLDFLDAALAGPLPDAGSIVLGLSRLEVLGHSGEPVAAPYPDYMQILRARTGRTVTVESADLAERVAKAADLVAVRFGSGTGRSGRGGVALTPPTSSDTLAYSRTFLLDAVRAACAEHLVLGLDDERSALSVAAADRRDDLAVVMPIRLHA